MRFQLSPRIKIVSTHSATEYELDTASAIIRRHENGFDTATLVLEDTETRNYEDKVTADDKIEIFQKDKSDASWNELFDGIVRRIDPIRSKQGNLLSLECDGAGYGLIHTGCGEEYGAESSHASLDTIREILKDATNGMIPLWVNKVLGTATDSGYSYTTYIEDIAGTVNYLYFPYMTSFRAINNLCDVLQGIKGAGAGPHWIVDVDKHFLLTTIGSHSAAGDNPAQYWPTWWDTDATGSTLEEGKNIANYFFQHLAKEANYILYHGRFKRPANGDFLTENQHALWDCEVAGTLSDDNVDYKVGSYSLQLTGTQNGGDIIMWYPASGAWNLDVTKLGGEHNIPSLSFYAMKNTDVTNVCVKVWFNGGVSGVYKMLTLTDDVWAGFNFTLGPYQNTPTSTDPWTYSGAPNWADVDSIRFEMWCDTNDNDKYLWIDGFHLNGWVLRGARPAAAYTSANPMRLKVITDEVAKDDSLSASDDSGLMGRLAYAELLRCQTTPIVGTITIPIAPTLLPGQKIHVHAKKKNDGSFRIDKDMRATRVVHSVTETGFLTTVDVTDDLTNANPRPIPTTINAALEAVRPEYQTRQASSMKAREIDITQEILEKSY